MTQTETSAPGSHPSPGAYSKSGRFRGIRRIFSPIAQAHGTPKRMLLVGASISVLFVLVAIFAPLIAPYDFDTYSSDGERFGKQQSPSSKHWFGTNVQSLDVLTRVIFGARTALEVMILAVVFSLIIGVLLGLVAGYVGGWLDRILVLIMDALFAFPYLLLAIVAGFMLSGIVGGGVVTAALSITVVYIPQYFRVVRSSALSAREELYVEAARAMGAKPTTVVSKYLFGNVVQSVPVITTINAGDAISTLAGLGFLGLGIQPTDAAEWGYDLQRSIEDVSMWWTAVFPGMAIVLVILGFTLLGEGLNDVLNPTVRRRRIGRVVLTPAVGRRRLHEAAARPSTAGEDQGSGSVTSAPESTEPPADSGEPASDAEVRAAEQHAETATGETVTGETATRADADTDTTSAGDAGSPADAEASTDAHKEGDR